MKRGTLRVYLGAAPGVGKTYAMLNEGWRRQRRGTDVVVGWVETHGRARTAEQIRDLELVPAKIVEYRGRLMSEMDLDAVLARHPEVALIDELAHTNVPGGTHAKRWQDVEALLDAGIDVVSTLNIQHLESLNDVVAAVTGVLQRETVPDAVVRAAEQVELVDMTPEALRRRMAHGNVYAPEKVDVALSHYFRAGNLSALRELTLLWLADQVDQRLQEYRLRHGIDETWETRERVLVALTGAPGGDNLIRRAARMARRAKGDLIGVHVHADDGVEAPAGSQLTQQRNVLEELGGHYREVVGSSVAKALVQVARAENATQIVLGASQRSRWYSLARGSVVAAVIRESGDAVDVHVISSTPHAPERRGAQHLPTGGSLRRHLRAPANRARAGALSWRRRLGGFLIALVGLPLLTSALVPDRLVLPLATVSLGYLLLVVAVATVGGSGPAALAAIGGFLLLNWYFRPPADTFSIAGPREVTTLVVFLVVATVISILVSLTARRGREAYRARSEAAALASASAALLNVEAPLPELVQQLRATFGLDAVSVLAHHPSGWRVEEAAGSDPPEHPSKATLSLPLPGDRVLALGPPRLRADEREVLNSFTTQLAVALNHRHLQAQAAAGVTLAKADEVRTALLAAVSHDLRTPLASIKAASTNLLDREVSWDPASAYALLETIDKETDRLNTLVGNLLDMSRLQAGELAVRVQVVGLDEIVSAAMTALPDARGLIELDVPDTLPRVSVDAALLEQAVLNLLSNALKFAPPSSSVRVEAGTVPGRVELRVIDRGPGIASPDRDRVFLPFQRLGDQDSATGVGLGLAVAKGFIEAMSGELSIEDTPGGGTTMVVSLKPESQPTHGIGNELATHGTAPVERSWG